MIFSFALFASMLSDADSIAGKYAGEVAKLPPPSLNAHTNELLGTTSSWISIDLDTLIARPGQTVLEILSDTSLWQLLQDLGINGLWMHQLKEGGSARTGFAIDPKWGNNGWANIRAAADSHGIFLVEDLLGATTGCGIDFTLALQNVSGYGELYQLIEIEKKDWKLLPKVPVGMERTNVSWLALNNLYKVGYVPEAAHPYVKESAWNTTGQIQSADGVTRRWIYLKENQNDPVLSWLSPSFAAVRIASADAIDWICRLGSHVLRIDGQLPTYAQEIEALWIRKIGGYSIATTNGTLAALQAVTSVDAILDAPTHPALLHALIAEDAEALRLIYHLYLDEKIPLMRLVHTLEPLRTSSCDWTEFLSNPKRHYRYREEKITGELLRERLLKEDLFRLRLENQDHFPISTLGSTWGGYCAMSFGIASPQEFDRHREEIQKAHLLLAFAYAMQPGIFSLSAADLVGLLGEGGRLSLLEPNPNALYPSFPCQMQTPRSFASQLKEILSVRASSSIARGELIAVPPVQHKGTLLLLHRLPGSRFIQLLALNFSRSPVQETLQLFDIQGTWAVDLMSGLSIEKGFESGIFSFDISPLSGRVFLFQPKYYD